MWTYMFWQQVHIRFGTMLGGPGLRAELVMEQPSTSIRAISATPLHMRSRQQPGRGKGVGETETQIPRPLSPQQFCLGFQGTCFGPGRRASRLWQHTHIIDEMAKLYRRHPGQTRHGDLCCRISLAQIVKERIGEDLIAYPVWGAYDDAFGHDASLTQPVYSAGARYYWSGVGTCRSLGIQGAHAWTAVNTVAAVSVRRQAIFNGGPQTFFSHG